MIYAGIGSRETPSEICKLFSFFAQKLGDRGQTLRSGGAPGADTAFEEGLSPQHPREIYLPQKGFNKSLSDLYQVTSAAYDLAQRYHPAWSRCNDKAKSLHARNGYQILGSTLDKPVDMVICQTKDGSGEGGTGQAIRIAKAYNIPVFDFGKGMHVVKDLKNWIDNPLVY